MYRPSGSRTHGSIIPQLPGSIESNLLSAELWVQLPNLDQYYLLYDLGCSEIIVF